jgi:hypothetical protein
VRGRLIKHAQYLARSGAYPDVDSIAAALASDGSFVMAQSWFKDSRFRAQLQRLCARATAGQAATCRKTDLDQR